MKSKKCFKCEKTKSIDDFYRHSAMPDGHLNKCKTCNKKDVAENYKKNHTHYVEYEKKRWLDPNRRIKALEYQRNRRKKAPGKDRARRIVNNALRDGIIKKLKCEDCGSLKTEAHHSDYRSPLKINWLCRKHHLKRHNKTANDKK